ncbi:carboxylesterase 2 [Rhinolophus ferrumequinum]|uniref:Carboxylesterase 2 n=2 Tax=Rhinolophus ferrumequinum TaxID=59479 RepID=A0A7J7SH61_RHIFE|nr:carboxylesterase 2 [Rhinolophus ferrumequinum]
MSLMSQGPFHCAIVESGIVLMFSFITSSSDVDSTMAANWSACGELALVDCMQSKSEEKILAISKIIPNVMDGTFLPRQPQELLASADFQPVPNLSGVNNDEYSWLNPSVRPSPMP